MGATKRTPEERRAMVARAWQLALAGQSQATIAVELGISQGQVSRWLASARKVVSDRLAEDMTTYLILSLRQNDLLLEEALAGFERSMRDARRTIRKDGVAVVEFRQRDGDPAWLVQVRDALRFRMELYDRVVPRPVAPASDPDAAGRDARLEEALREAERRDAEYVAGSAHEPPPSV